jgi:hypothetical protein
MLNSFVVIHIVGIAGAPSARGTSASACLHKQFNMITTTTNAAT